MSTDLSMLEAKSINSSTALIIFVFTDDTDEWMGVSVKKYGCDASEGRIILKWRCSVLKAAKTFAHENGHLLGLAHDADEDEKDKLNVAELCAGTGLMSDAMEVGEQPELWSLCSKARLQVWYSNRGDCLRPAVECNDGSGNWATPCLCGSGEMANLCTDEHTCCESSTNKCLDEEFLKEAVSKLKPIMEEALEESKIEESTDLTEEQVAVVTIIAMIIVVIIFVAIAKIKKLLCFSEIEGDCEDAEKSTLRMYSIEKTSKSSRKSENSTYDEVKEGNNP